MLFHCLRGIQLKKQESNRVQGAGEIQHPVLTPAQGARGRSGLGCDYYPTTRKYSHVADCLRHLPLLRRRTIARKTKTIEFKGPASSIIRSLRLQGTPGAGQDWVIITIPRMINNSSNTSEKHNTKTNNSRRVQKARAFPLLTFTPPWGAMGRSRLGCNYRPSANKYLDVVDF